MPGSLHRDKKARFYQTSAKSERATAVRLFAHAARVCAPFVSSHAALWTMSSRCPQQPGFSSCRRPEAIIVPLQLEFFFFSGSPERGEKKKIVLLLLLPLTAALETTGTISHSCAKILATTDGIPGYTHYSTGRVARNEINMKTSWDLPGGKEIREFCVTEVSVESFYVSPPTFVLTKSSVFETSSRPYLLKYGAPCHPDVIVP